MINIYKKGGLKDVDIFYKIVSLQCLWINMLFENNLHDWKVILLYLIEKDFRKYFKFHSNLDINAYLLKNFPRFYQEILTRWSNDLASPATFTLTIISQFLWFNTHIKIGEKSICTNKFSNKNRNFVGQLFKISGNIISLKE